MYSGKESHFEDLPQFVSLRDIENSNTFAPPAPLSVASLRPFNDCAPQPNITQPNQTQPEQCTATRSHLSVSSFDDTVPSFDAPPDSYPSPSPPGTFAIANPQSFQLQSSVFNGNSSEPIIQAPSSPAQSLSFTCQVCGKSYPKKYQLTKHNLRHQPPLRCSYESCNLSFSENKDLRRHILQVHQQRRDFQCDRCMKNFSRVENLRRHQATACRGLR